MRAEVRDHLGMPALIINGEPVPPMMFTGRITEENSRYIAGLARAGIRIFFLMCTTDWITSEPIGGGWRSGAFSGFSRFEKEARVIRASAPDAYIIPRVSLNPPASWLREHPEELICDRNGAYENFRFAYPPLAEYRGVGMYSLASQKWREEGGARLAGFIDLVESSDFAEHVAGYFLAAGGTDEWYYPGEVGGPEFLADYGSAFRACYGRLLKEKYGSLENLKAAWRKTDVSFTRPIIPSYDERHFSRVDDFSCEPATSSQSAGSFLNADTSQHVADFYRAWNYGTADSIIHFAGTVKQKTESRKVVGSFYGSYGSTHFQNTGTVSGVCRILDSGVVDFLAAPGNYENRVPGGVTAQREMQDSFRLRNRIFVVEEDTRTFLSDESNRSFTRTFNLDTTLEVMKRDFGRNLCEDLQAWWFDMAPEGGWYDHPRIIDLIRRQQELAARAYSLDRRTAAEVALIFDEESTWYTSNRTLADICDTCRNLEFHRIGTPVAYHFHNDFDLPNMPEYKLYVFLNVFCLTGRERHVIARQVRRGGKTALWVYAPGFINPDYNNPGRDSRMNAAQISDLTAIEVEVVHERLNPGFTITNPTHPACRSLTEGVEYGCFDQPTWPSGGEKTKYKRPVPTRQTDLNPWFRCIDPEADILGEFCSNGEPAYAIREYENWRSLYHGAKVLRRAVLNAAARFAGCHIYAATDDIIYASRHFVTIHAKTGGKKRITLPYKSDPFEVYQCTEYGRNTTTIDLDIPAGHTRTFYLHGWM